MKKPKMVVGVKIEKLKTAVTGSVRSDRAGKGRYDLIPPVALRRLALRYEGGAITHGDRNWEKGMSAGRCYDSVFRHMNQWAAGDLDEDHLAAAMWNIAALMYHEHHKPEFLDMPGLQDALKKLRKPW